jgi:hypothetical protein
MLRGLGRPDTCGPFSCEATSANRIEAVCAFDPPLIYFYRRCISLSFGNLFSLSYKMIIV